MKPKANSKIQISNKSTEKATNPPSLSIYIHSSFNQSVFHLKLTIEILKIGRRRSLATTCCIKMLKYNVD